MVTSHTSHSRPVKGSAHTWPPSPPLPAPQSAHLFGASLVLAPRVPCTANRESGPSPARRTGTSSSTEKLAEETGSLVVRSLPQTVRRGGRPRAAGRVARGAASASRVQPRRPSPHRLEGAFANLQPDPTVLAATGVAGRAGPRAPGTKAHWAEARTCKAGSPGSARSPGPARVPANGPRPRRLPRGAFGQRDLQPSPPRRPLHRRAGRALTHPEPAAVVAWMELMRRRLAVSFRACSFCWSGLW